MAPRSPSRTLATAIHGERGGGRSGKGRGRGSGEEEGEGEQTAEGEERHKGGGTGRGREREACEEGGAKGNAFMRCISALRALGLTRRASLAAD